MFVEIIFYAVFISQIFLISYHYPKKTYDRNAYVFNTYPASEYPKLYGHSKYIDAVGELKKATRRYLRINYAIALLGVGVLLAMVLSGYKPSSIKENENILLVVFYFLLQSIPHIMAEISAHKWYKHMRNTDRPSTRKAELHPRKLFDFISPFSLAFAVLAFAMWLVYYLYNKGLGTAWDWQSYITIFVMVGLNFVLIALGYRYLRGAKLDPHQARADHHKFTGIILRIFVFAIILMSLQLTMFDGINQNGWDMFEPAAMSLCFQLAVFFGIGELLRSFKIENIDFSVYKKETGASPV